MTLLWMAASQASAQAPFGQGELKTLLGSPTSVSLRELQQPQQLLVTGTYANGGERDFTSTARYVVADPKVVRVDETGMLLSLAVGSTTVTADVAGKKIQWQVKVENHPRPIHFPTEIVAIFGKLGCNAGACHGKASGQNGFKLSLLGFEPKFDHDALVNEARGRRVFPAAPESSLLLRKATGTMAHGGGSRLSAKSREYQLLSRWMAQGMPFGQDSDPQVVKVSVVPEHRLIGFNASQQLAVTAHLSDGSQRDITDLAEYSSNDTEILNVTPTGRAETQATPGQGAVMVRYLGHFAVFRAMVPQSVPADKLVMPPPANFIDTHVFKRLEQLAIVPSERCSDADFLRRAALDVTGTLPTAKEAKDFLDSKDPKKRERLIDDLLARPTYASYFALKWADVLRNRRNGLVGVGGGAERTKAFHAWIRDGILANKPYDQFAREILTSQGDVFGPNAQPAVAWYNVLKKPEVMVDDMAQIFLGTRIQCAQCHHHPFEKWTQDDYWGLTAFFARVQLEKAKGNTKQATQTLKIAPAGSVQSPQKKWYAQPRVLDGPELTLDTGEDPRPKLAAWMVDRNNPYFARAIVNRYWSHFMGRGLVEPLDDMRASNPPTNPELLDALAADFVKHNYDLKHLIRTICTSATYQLSSQANEYNRKDKQNFARFQPRRLPAEVLFDAFDQVAGVTSKFQSSKGVERAIDLPDEADKSATLEAFGKPDRSSACECERVSAATLTQSLHMIGSDEIHKKIASKAGRAAQYLGDARPTAAKVQELYLAAFARYPDAEELKIAVDFLDVELRKPRPADVSRTGGNNYKQWPYEDLIWALINTKEFSFNH